MAMDWTLIAVEVVSLGLGFYTGYDFGKSRGRKLGIEEGRKRVYKVFDMMAGIIEEKETEEDDNTNKKT
jgi:hypothetical protein